MNFESVAARTIMISTPTREELPGSKELNDNEVKNPRLEAVR